jgi:prolyl 4-hydroxylase
MSKAESSSLNFGMVTYLVQGALLGATVAFMLTVGNNYDLREWASKFSFKNEMNGPMAFNLSLSRFDDQKYLETYKCDPDYRFRMKMIRRDPLIMEIEDFLAPGEAEHLAITGLGNLKRSTVADYEESEVRTSSSAFLAKSADAVLECIEKRASYITGLPIENIEGLQVVKYVHGQYYKEHHDFFDPAFDGENGQLSRGGQRLVTIFVYLNTVAPEHGGQTYFPEIDLQFQPKKNHAAFWWNVNVNGTIEPRTLHSAEPVDNVAEKYGLNIWIREGPFY